MTRRSIDTSVDGCARIRPSLQCFVKEIGMFDALSRSSQQGTPRAADVASASAAARTIFRKGTTLGEPVQEASSAIPVSSKLSSSVNCNDAACTFSSRCAIEEVPGIGSTIGDRFSNHANATWMGFIWRAFAIRASTLPATVPAPSGNHGMNAISLRSQ